MSVIRLSIRPILTRNLTANNEMVKKLVINLSSSHNLSKQTTRNYSAILNKHNVLAASAKIMPKNVRSIAIQEITKNIQLFTEEPRNVDKDANTLRLKTPIEKPLVVMMAWLLAKQTHLAKYAQIYIDQGFDVVTVVTTPWQLLWPTKGTQIIAADLVKFLENNAKDSPLLMHGFSVGGYLWGECMVQMTRDTDRYRDILNRFCGQIWDSAADITEIPVGVPKAMFPNNKTLENALRSYMLYHLKTFHVAATTHYIRSSQMFHSTMLRGPALFLISKTDPIGAEHSNQRVRENWESMGVQCTWKCWDKSPHVGHYQRHREEYLEALFNHLMMINMVKYPEKLRAKL